MRSLRLRAPAKINWTLEVLGKRSDGYHEVRTIMQTIDLADTITLREADDISFALAGDSSALAGQPVEENLAYRAALLLRLESTRGVQIELEKHIPVAAGLGGGSSDAAAVLRGLRILWALDVSNDGLTSMASELGSDVPFFLYGGTAVASGRGELIERLPDISEKLLVIAWPTRTSAEPKTARMYAAFRSEQYSDGSITSQLVERLRSGVPVRDADVCNAFEQVLGDVDADTAAQVEAARRFRTPHLCGSGPAIFFLLASKEEAKGMVNELASVGLESIVTKTISASESLATGEWL